VSSDDARRLQRELERFLNVIVRRRVSEPENPFQLTSLQRFAMALIVDRGPLRLGELADLIGTSDPTATRVVDALAGLGYAERT
jgi:DNA-binding MarR family transcriptional regulator